MLAVAGVSYGFSGVAVMPTPAGFPMSYISTQWPCAGHNVGVSLVPVRAPSVPINATGALVGGYEVHLIIEAIGQVCDRYGDYVAVRHASVNLTVRDLTHAFNATDIWFAGLDMAVTSPSPLVSSVYSLPSKANVTQLGPGSAVLLGSAAVDWQPQMATHLNVTFTQTVFADTYSIHGGDTLQFLASVLFAVDSSACFGGCWSPFSAESFNGSVRFEVPVISS